MELLMKASALLLISSLTGLLIRKGVPELALLLCIAAVTGVFLMASSLAGEWKVFIDTVRALTKDAPVFTHPILKCLSIAVITQITSELCRDASQGAASSAIELMGTVCALCTAMPLILSILKTLGGLL